MDHHSSAKLENFKNHVALKFQLYNSLFTALPFHRIEKTGILLSLLLENCSEGYANGDSPMQIIETFFDKHTSYTTEAERLDLLFRFIQYAERQVVLFDAVEDAAFRQVNDMVGAGSLKHLESEVLQFGKSEQLKEKLKDFAVRLVLTAHPTQFYPGAVLGIINDISKALAVNNTSGVDMYLQQLGKTPFLNKEQPTPFDEAMSLVWFLENVFYHAVGNMASFMEQAFPGSMDTSHPAINLGFWPGGDRDGNPNVNAGITLKVAEALRGGIIKCYYQDVRKLRRRLTFKGIDHLLSGLENQLYNNLFIPGQRTGITQEAILDTLEQVKQIIEAQHDGLFLSLVQNLINKVYVFGLHFAALDIRQESSVHTALLDAIAQQENILPKDYSSLTEEKKIDALTGITQQANPFLYEDAVLKDTLLSFRAMETIQQSNGEAGCNRYIISQCNSALNVMEVYGLFVLSNGETAMNMDIIPLFETIEDLTNAEGIMTTLYSNKIYAAHLKKRNNTQTIMLGFSDGTKDGGYLAANWNIYKAKKALTAISMAHGFEVIFFDGRGGPPARGGGKSHQFYASMGKDISSKEIQITIQGQTISSGFGNIDSARYNMEQLLNAGISTSIFQDKPVTFDEQETKLVDELADESLSAYLKLRNHPEFINYLAHVSPLRFYNDTNIGSRPSKRKQSAGFSLKDLRAIPFVGSWTQLKQNVTGFYGVGTAMKALEEKGKLGAIKTLYRSSLFFKTLVDNCEMSMKKCFFPLTAYLSDDPQYGMIWNMIHDEYKLAKKYIFQLLEEDELMQHYPTDQLSISMREKIILPLLSIQQYALSKLREKGDADFDEKKTYEKLVIRCSFGIINAGRNSV